MSVWSDQLRQNIVRRYYTRDIIADFRQELSQYVQEILQKKKTMNEYVC